MAQAKLNKTLLIGNLTIDPDSRTTHRGEKVCSFNIAVNEGTPENPLTTFVKIETWGKVAETCGRYLRKGAGVLIDGRLRLDSWQDKNGSMRQQLFVVAQTVQFLSRPRTEEGEDQDYSGGYQQQQQPQRSSGGVDPRSEYAQPPMPPVED